MLYSQHLQKTWRRLIVSGDQRAKPDSESQQGGCIRQWGYRMVLYGKSVEVDSHVMIISAGQRRQIPPIIVAYVGPDLIPLTSSYPMIPSSVLRRELRPISSPSSYNDFRKTYRRVWPPRGSRPSHRDPQRSLKLWSVPKVPDQRNVKPLPRPRSRRMRPVRRLGIKNAVGVSFPVSHAKDSSVAVNTTLARRLVTVA